MQNSFIGYDYEKSFERIDSIIAESENSFEEVDEIPSRTRLTYTNGFYVNCSTLFIDIRDSSKLTDIHKRPKLAKLYRAYISEVVAILSGDANCIEVDIIGDGISGIFDARFKSQIDDVFSTAAKMGSLIDVINYKFQKNDIETIKVGIGMSIGRTLMIKAGYNGSGINEIVWMGDVVNQACHLGELPLSYGLTHEIKTSTLFYSNLSDNNQKFLSLDYQNNCYKGCVVNTGMNAWYKNNCL